MILIDFVTSREILNSRGQPTLETTVFLSDGTQGVASIPSGASTSGSEALELKDKDYARFFGEGVLHAVKNVNETIAPRLKKMNPLEQEKIDKLLLDLDQTPNKAHLGANAMLSVSQASVCAAANLLKKPLYQYINELFSRIESKDKYEEKIVLPPQLASIALPTPMFNLINGGKHAENPLKFQEYLVVPGGIAKVSEQVRAAAEIDRTLRNQLLEKGFKVAVGDEGGFAPHLESDTAALDFLIEAVKEAGYKTPDQIAFSLDLAANHFYANGKYALPSEEFTGNGEQLANFYRKMLEKYPFIYSLEDPFYEEDWGSFTAFKKEPGRAGLKIVGDDLISTNRSRVLRAIEEEAMHAVVIKPNQIGTISETLNVAKLAKGSGFFLVAAHRSGETNDTFIVDLAVGIGAQFLKAGAPVRGERVAKYNRLMKIAEEIE